MMTTAVIKRKIPVFHNVHNPCFELAFHFTHIPVIGELLRAEMVIKLDGETPNVTDLILCGHCGNSFIPDDNCLMDLRDLKGHPFCPLNEGELWKSY